MVLKYLSTTCEQDFPRLSEKEKKSPLRGIHYKGVLFLFHLPVTFIISECMRAFTGIKNHFHKDKNSGASWVETQIL